MAMQNDPHVLFETWLADARASEINDPDAMAISTVDPAGRPSARMVLLKGHDARGFVFYTNQQSRKAVELAANSHITALFHWKSLRRQVRIEGSVEVVDTSEADTYFATRSRDSRLGAWASDQSRPLASRVELERRLAEVRTRFEGGDVPRPPHWSGYRIKAGRIEFWSDGAHRLHDRRLFMLGPAGWSTGLLYP